MKKVYAIVVGLLLLAVPAFAADVDANGLERSARRWATCLSSTSSRLTNDTDRTTLGFDGGSIPIKNGKVEGDKISFTVTFDFGRHDAGSLV